MFLQLDELNLLNDGWHRREILSLETYRRGLKKKKKRYGIIRNNGLIVLSERKLETCSFLEEPSSKCD